jgi:hypothetical protein
MVSASSFLSLAFSSSRALSLRASDTSSPPKINLDELIRATTHAHNSLLDLEELTEADLEKFRDHYCRLAQHARKHDFNVGEAIAELEAEEKAMEMKLRQEARGKRRKKALGPGRETESVGEVAENP